MQGSFQEDKKTSGVYPFPCEQIRKKKTTTKSKNIKNIKFMKIGYQKNKSYELVVGYQKSKEKTKPKYKTLQQKKLRAKIVIFYKN